MKKTDLLIGFAIGILACFLGTFLFITIFTDYDFATGIQVMKSSGNMGKIITLGAVFCLIIFFILLKINKELMARGVVLATIVLTIITLLI